MFEGTTIIVDNEPYVMERVEDSFSFDTSYCDYCDLNEQCNNGESAFSLLDLCTFVDEHVYVFKKYNGTLRQFYLTPVT